VRAAVRGEGFRIRVIRGELFRVGAQSKHWRGAWRNY
jgi:ribosomal protein L10